MHGRQRNNAPYWIKTRYGGTCDHCKLGIKKGEDVLYYPQGGKVLCAGQECGRQAQRDMDANRQDELTMYGQGGWNER
jgi:hypothetical protein